MFGFVCMIGNKKFRLILSKKKKWKRLENQGEEERVKKHIGKENKRVGRGIEEIEVICKEEKEGVRSKLLFCTIFHSQGTICRLLFGFGCSRFLYPFFCIF
jgi:hypothetical protein